MSLEQMIREKFLRLQDTLNEQQKRLWAASEALSYGYGGVTAVHKATGLSRLPLISASRKYKKEHF